MDSNNTTGTFTVQTQTLWQLKGTLTSLVDRADMVGEMVSSTYQPYVYLLQLAMLGSVCHSLTPTLSLSSTSWVFGAVSELEMETGNLNHV